MGRGEDWFQIRRAKAARRAVRTAAFVILGACLATAACGTKQAQSPETSASFTTTAAVVTTGAPSMSTSSGAGERQALQTTSSGPANLSAVDQDVQAAFAETATALYPVAVYAPAVLPAGAELAEQWIPVTAVGDASSPAQPPASNPHLSLEGSEPQAEVLVRLSDGELRFLENFRGDLGDVTGEPVGDVAGHPAIRYDLDDGVLVQWSDGGRWYAVYGRGEGAAYAVQVGLAMALLRP